MKIINNYKLELIVTVIWLLVILLINPTGNFPLNDDWCYAKSVKTLLEDNYLKLYNWGEMTLVGQVIWGFLFTKLFGFSFTVLRVSTLVFALISFFGLIKIFKLINLSDQLSMFAVLLCMFNPIFLELSFTFMTDVPFYTLSIYVFYFFLKNIKTQNPKYIIYAFVLCGLAYSIRQLALVYALSWFVFSVFSNKFKIQNFIKSFLLLLLFVVFSIGFDFLLKSSGVIQERFNSKFHLLINNLLNFDKGQVAFSAKLFFTSLAYIGLFISPIIIFKIKQVNKLYLRILTPIYTIIVFCFLYRCNYILPSLDNIWIDFGVGPFTLYNENPHFKKTPSPYMPNAFYYVLTIIGVFCSSILLYPLFEIVKYKKLLIEDNKVKFFTLVFMIIYLFPFLIVALYDRYLLVLFPLGIVCVLSDYKGRTSSLNKSYALVFTVGLAWFSVCATHDYLSWNRVRWEVLNELTDTQKISTKKINGGAEFITWYHFSETKEKWWEDVTPVYVITTDVNSRDKVINEYKYSRWLPGEGRLYLIYNKDLEY
jgi:hypothetical protein